MSDVQRVGIVFSGGPAPAANAVISAAAVSFLEDGREVVGFFHGYSNLQEYDPERSPLIEDDHYRLLTDKDVRGIRNTRGILLGTSRANPGRDISHIDDLDNPEKTQGLQRTYDALVHLGVDALISIGGDGTLRTSNLLHIFQQRLPADAPRVRILHLPKTIDNDYNGIDFTFGFFTAVDVLAKEVMNLRADAQATSTWFIVETMGRKAGWLAYGVGIAGETNLVVAVEDVDASLQDDSGFLDIDKLTNRIVDVMLRRESRHKHYGTIVVAEGLAGLLPRSVVTQIARDEYGHLSLGNVDITKILVERIKRRYAERTGRKKSVKGVQLGYESRCAPPHAFDVMLGSQLGIGAYRGLVEERLEGHMVTVSGQLELDYIPFHELVDGESLVTEMRFVTPGSDFHRLARFLETRTERANDWSTGPRREG